MKSSFLWNKKRALIVLVGAALVLCALIRAVADGSGPRVKTNGDRVKFLADLGWQVDEQPLSVSEVVIPMEFSDVYRKFNELQTEQGYDLADHQGERTVIYAYRVRNYAGYDGPVIAELYVAGGRVIGGDIHSLALDGFMHSLKRRGPQ